MGLYFRHPVLPKAFSFVADEFEDQVLRLRRDVGVLWDFQVISPIKDLLVGFLGVFGKKGRISYLFNSPAFRT